MKIKLDLSTSLRHKYVEACVLFSLVGVILFAIISMSNTQVAHGYVNGGNPTVTSDTWNGSNTVEKK
jgi:hypothetical protein